MKAQYSDFLNRIGPGQKYGTGQIELACERFFGGTSAARFDFSDEGNAPLFEAACAALGPLKPDEVYDFVPSTSSGKWQASS